MKGLQLTENQERVLLALYDVGERFAYDDAKKMGQRFMMGAWSLVRSKGLARYWVYPDGAFELTDRGKLIARMLRA